MKLTKTRIDKIEPPSKGYELHWDSELPGFGLRVTAKGAKSFIAQAKIDGKARRITLGRFGNLTADQARKKARAELGRMADNVDPAAVKAE
ncbi:MAG: Arm DNA-binding domain-containing protein, partial [Wenzhouxiangellaceae bacterium]|nr:Arm DNA-binding domain-containing protein [Wenzhouxiangellaceae bacterium]